MSRPKPLFVRVLVIWRGSQWLAQGLEYDLATQAPTDQQAIYSFLRILRARLLRDAQLGRSRSKG